MGSLLQQKHSMALLRLPLTNRRRHLKAKHVFEDVSEFPCTNRNNFTKARLWISRIQALVTALS